MDIHEINNQYSGQLGCSSRVQKDKGFKQVFARKLAEANATTPQAPIDGSGGVLECSNRILSLLEEYARELSDPRKSLREIEPLVRRIREEVSLIEPGASEKLLNDSGIERFIRELAVTASVAVFKFQRGDYI